MFIYKYSIYYHTPHPHKMQDRIYCAEQIKIPHDYPEIIRLYSKAVLAEQPNDITRFSIKYFGRLNAEHSTGQAQPYQPNLKQLKEIYNANKDSSCDKYVDSLKAEIGEEKCTQLLNWCSFCQSTYKLDASSSHLVLTLLFCLITPSLYDALSAIFYVLQG